MGMEQHKKRIIKRYIWIMFGILISFMAAMMKASGGGQWNRFFAQGEVYEFSPETFMLSTDSCAYDEDTGTYTVLTKKAVKRFPLIRKKKSWSYMVVNMSNLNRESARVIFAFYDRDKVKLFEQENDLANGENLIPVMYPEEFQRIKMILYNQEDLSFTLDGMRLQDREGGFATGSFLKYFVLTFAVYAVVSGLILLCRGWDGYGLIEYLQYIFILFGNCLGRKMGGNISQKARSRIRRVLFFLLFLHTVIFQALGLYGEEDFYRFGILGSVVVLILIALFSWERMLDYVNWRRPLPIAWFSLWAGICISDFIVSKLWKFSGYAAIFGISFFFFVWNQMERPKQMRNDLIRGLEWTFFPVVIYCMFFRQRTEGVSYHGAYCNQRDMALYLVVILIAFLAELFYSLVYSREKKGMENIAYICGSAVAIYLLWQTGAAMCIAAAGMTLLVFFYKLLNRKKRVRGKRLPLALLCAVAAVLVVHFSITEVPELLGTNLVYEREGFEVVDRKVIWEDYIRSLNLFGNEESLIIYEKNTMAFNGILEMAYRYGIFILIPYLGLLFLSLERTFREKGFLMTVTTVAFLMVLLTENVEQPLAHPLWFLFYLGMGIWFSGEASNQNRKERRGSR